MSSLTDVEEFSGLTRAFSRSYVVQAVGRGAGVVRRSLPHSWCWRRLSRGSAAIAGLGAAGAVRFVGILLLAAVLTHRALLPFVPSLARPAFPASLTVEWLLLSLVFIGAAPWLERAWPSSYLRRTVSGR